MSERPRYIVMLNPPPQYDPLNQRPQYQGYLTVLEVESYISGLPRSVGETAVVYQNVPLDYRPAAALVTTFDEQKPKKRRSDGR